MSTRIEFKCDFCGKKLTDESVNPDCMGYCRVEDSWTNNLRKNIDGPHICETCSSHQKPTKE